MFIPALLTLLTTILPHLPLTSATNLNLLERDPSPVCDAEPNPSPACNEDNCLRAFNRYSNIHAATSFCASYIPAGTLVTSTTTSYYTYSEQNFLITPGAPVYTTYYTYTALFTSGGEYPAVFPTPTPPPYPLPTPAFMTGRACNGDPARLSSACSCVVSSVTSVQAVVNVQEIIVTAYIGPPILKRTAGA